MCAESRVPWVPAVSRESRAVRDPLVPAAQLVQWDPGDRRACVETLVPRATQAASDFRVYEAIPVRWVQRGTGDQWVQRVIPVRKVPSVSEGNAEKKVNEDRSESRDLLENRDPRENSVLRAYRETGDVPVRKGNRVSKVLREKRATQAKRVNRENRVPKASRAFKVLREKKATQVKRVSRENRVPKASRAFKVLREKRVNQAKRASRENRVPKGKPEKPPLSPLQRILLSAIGCIFKQANRN